MGLSLLALCQRALRERAVFSVPSTILDASNVTAIRLQMAADKTGRAFRDLGGWEKLQQAYEFSTVIGQSNYDLPDGLLRILNFTQWNRDQYTKIYGPTPPSQWDAMVSGNTAAAANTQYWRKRLGQFWVFPLPTTEDLIRYEYVSRNWVLTAGDTQATKEYFSADTDTCIFEDDLMVSGIKERYQSIILGIDFQPSPEYDALISSWISSDAGAPVVDYGARAVPSGVSEGSIPDNSWPSS